MSRSRTVVVMASFIWASTAFAQTSADTVTRCIFDIGEFGNEAVDMCVKQDLAAEKELKTYSLDSAEVIADCTMRMKAGGWAMVKRCVDRTLAGGAKAR